MIWLFWRVSVAMERLAGWAERAGSWADLQRVRAIDRQREGDDLFMGVVGPPRTSEQYFQDQIDLYNKLIPTGRGYALASDIKAAPPETPE